MKWFWASGLCLAGLATGVSAEEVTWRPAGPRRATPGVTLQPPRPLSAGVLQASASQPSVDAGVLPISFRAPVAGKPQWVRAHTSEPPPFLPDRLDSSVQPVQPEPPSEPEPTLNRPEPMPPAENERTLPAEEEQEAPLAAQEPPLTPPDPQEPPLTPPDPQEPPPTPPVAQEPATDFATAYSRSAETQCGAVVADEIPVAPEAPEAVPADEPASRAANRLYLRAEYLRWRTSGSLLPPLVTASPAAAGNQGPTLLFGDSSVNSEARSGGRFTVGYWFDPEQTLGLEGQYFFLGQRSTNFAAGSNEFPVLAVPFLNLNTGQADRLLLAPADAAGTDRSARVRVDVPSRLWGAESSVRCSLWSGPEWRLDLLGGLRYLDLAEGLHLSEDVVSVRMAPPGPAPVPAQINEVLLSDRFDTRNHFYGGQLGLRTAVDAGRWVLEGYAKVGLGVNNEVVDIAGSQTVITVAGAQPPINGGVLATQGNSGHFSRSRFAVVPEAGIKVGYKLSEEVLAYVGYDLLYWSNAVRPGEQVDRTLDPARLPNFAAPGPANPTGRTRPIFLFKETSYWAQGLNCGVELRY